VFFENVYKSLKAGHYLIRLKKKFIDNKLFKKHDSTDKIVVTSSSKVKFDYKQPELRIFHPTQLANTSETFCYKWARGSYNTRKTTKSKH